MLQPLASDLQLKRVLASYDVAAESFETVTAGLIHRSLFLRDGQNQRIAVAQRLHPAFAPSVNTDIHAVTKHLQATGIPSPSIIPTVNNQLCVMVDDHCWRLLTYVDGTSLSTIDNPVQAHAAGMTLGRFHQALTTLTHTFVFRRENVHNTSFHLTRLQDAIAKHNTFPSFGPLAHDIVQAANHLPTIHSAPNRILHGDPKLSNILFDNPTRQLAICLVDFDGVGTHSIAYELGDALRSWCTCGPQDQPKLSLELTRASLQGYRSTQNDLIPAEINSIIPALETVCVELAARFCVDIIEDHYFAWDETHYSSRAEHNTARAAGQLFLAQTVAKHRSVLEEIVCNIF